MKEDIGQYNTAVCYTGELEDAAAGQIKAVCDQPAFADCKIRIMPDVHAGMGCTIGTTMTITDKIVPGMVGVDIGCGMETVRIAEKEIDFTKLDTLIHTQIPCGRDVRKEPHVLNNQIDLTFPLAEDILSIEAFVSATGVQSDLDKALSLSSINWYFAAGFGFKMEVPGFPLGLYLVKNATMLDNEGWKWQNGTLFSGKNEGSGLSLVLAITTSLY